MPMIDGSRWLGAVRPRPRALFALVATALAAFAVLVFLGHFTIEPFQSFGLNIFPSSNSSSAPHVIPPNAYTLSNSLRTSPSSPITFIPYTFGYEMLLQTLRVYQRAGWRNIVVIDNSWKRDAWKERDRLASLGVSQVVLTTARTFCLLSKITFL
jgi:hypothetical protein